MPQNETNEKFAGTYRKLFNTIERGSEQCSTDRLQTLLEEKKEQLKLGLDAFTEPSSQARSKINSTGTSVTVDGKTIKLEQNEKDLVLRLSDITKLNELQAASVWDTFKQSNKYKSDRAETPLCEDVQLLMNVINFYFEDRLSLLECVSSLKRISLDAQHPYTSIANDTISKFHQNNDSTTYLQQLFSQYAKLVRSHTPRQHEFFNGWSLVWAKQALKEEKALLEIIFLYALTEIITPKFVLSMIQEFEADCFGYYQAFSYVLDEEGAKLRDKVTYICMVLSASIIVPPSLKVGTTLDAANTDKTLLDSPEYIAKINQIACYMGDRKEHAIFLLAWSFFLTCADAILSDQDTTAVPANYTQIMRPILDGTQTISSSVLIDRTLTNNVLFVPISSRDVCIEQHPHMDRIYLGRSLKLDVFSSATDVLESEICSEEDSNSYGYRTVLSHLYASFLSVTRPHYLPTESYASLIKSYCLIYKNQPELCQAFWKDFNADSTSSLLATARGRFPVYFTDFIHLLSALTGASPEHNGSSNSDSAARVFEYLCNIPSITVVVSPDVDITAVDENNEVVVHAGQAIQVTEAFDAVNGIVVPENSRGLLLSKAEEPIVRYPLHYDGWHLLVSVLTGFVTHVPVTSTHIVDTDQYLQGKNLEGIVSILDLIHNVLSGSPSLATRLVQHVERVASFFSSKTSDAPILISVLGNILSTSSTLDVQPIPVLTLAVKCMTLLLPYYRDAIWAYLKNAPILPTTNTSFHTGLVSYSSKLASFAQIQSIVSQREYTDGRYTLLLAFLDLVQALAQDIQRSWWVNDSAQRQYQLEVLNTCLHYIMAEVFPTYSSWRYKKISECYLIGIKVLNLFIYIVSNLKEPVTTALHAKLSLNGLGERILDNFLYSGVACHINPLVQVICDGARTASTYYSLGHPKEAERAEKLTEMTFVFVKILLQHRLEQIEQGTSLPDTSLERLLLERTPNSTSSDFLLRIAKHIKYRHNISLPIQATNVLTLLCRTTAAWKTAPNFNQYLGSSAQVHVIIRLYLDIAKDQFQNEALLTSIWQLLTVLMETQPSLAILFLDCGDLIMPSPKSAVRTLPGRPPQAASTSVAQSTDSAVRAAIDTLGFYDTLSVEKPAVVSNVLHFLDTFWRTAFDHYALVERARVDNALWEGLGKVLLNPTTDVDATHPEIQSLDLLDAVTTNNDTRHDTHVRRLCCLNLSKALVMRIIACEIHLTAGKTRNPTAAIADKLPIGLKNLLSKVGEPSKLISMRDSFVKNDFDSSVVRQAETSASVLLQTIGVPSNDALLLKIPRFGSGDDGAAGEARQYGDSFLYDYRLACNRIQSLHKDVVAKYGSLDQESMVVDSDMQAVLDLKQFANQFLQSLLLANYNCSIVDSQVILLRAFETFVETCSRRATDLVWANKTGASGSDSLYLFLKGLVENAQRETRSDGVALTSYSILIQFIRSLTEDWINKNSAVVTGTDMAAQKTYATKAFDILSALCDLLDRENYAVYNSIRDDTAICFHRPLLEAIMLIVRTLRGTISLFTSHSPEHMQFQKCYTPLLNVVCSSFSVLTTKAISYSADESLVSPDAVENCIKDVTVVVAQLQELINPKYGVSQDIWLDAFEKYQTIPSLLSLLFAGIELVVGEVDRQTVNLNSAIPNISITPYPESALCLLLGLSNIPKAAERLVKHNIYDLLVNNTLSPRLQRGTLDLFIRFGDGKEKGPSYVERNPLHVIWCQILGVLNNLMCHVGSDELVLQSTANLMQMYGPQIGTALARASGATDFMLSMKPSESFSAPLLEEIDRINMLFFRLSQYLDRLENVANNLFVSYKDCTLLMLQHYLYSYTHPSHMQKQLYPMDSEERQQAVTFVTAKSTSTTTSSSTSESEEPAKIHTSQLMQKTVQLTLTITHHMLTTLINLANTDVILTQPDSEWPFGNTIIYPDMRVILGELASFGTLTELMNVCLHMLSQWQDVAHSPNKQLLNVLEDAALLLTTQSLLWIAKPDIEDKTRSEIAQENVLDIAEALNKSTTALTKLESTIKDQKVKEKRKTIHYLQQVLGKRLFTE